MAGAYCRYCDQRCFVNRTLPDDSRWMPGQTVHLATCGRGKAHDREGTGGYDADNTLNPITGYIGDQPVMPSAVLGAAADRLDRLAAWEVTDPQAWTEQLADTPVAAAFLRALAAVPAPLAALLRGTAELVRVTGERYTDADLLAVARAIISTPEETPR